MSGAAANNYNLRRWLEKAHIIGNELSQTWMGAVSSSPAAAQPDYKKA